MSAIDTDVLIVGAGPVGLFVANECARRGLRWRLVETRSSQSEYSKALAIFPRTLEIFDMAGFVAHLQRHSKSIVIGDDTGPGGRRHAFCVAGADIFECHIASGTGCGKHQHCRSAQNRPVQKHAALPACQPLDHLGCRWRQLMPPARPDPPKSNRSGRRMQKVHWEAHCPRRPHVPKS